MDEERMLNNAERAVQLKERGTTREQVEQALSVCCEWVRDASGEHKKDCYRCCYWDESDKAALMCSERLMRDARELIRARVLKLQEIPQHSGAVWIEVRNVPDYLEPAVYRYEQQPFFRFSGKDHAFGLDLATATYNDDWRAWTVWPSPEERKKAPWR